MADFNRWAMWVVVAHTIVVTVHAGAHGALQVLPGPLDSLFIVVVYFASPIAAAVLLGSRPRVAFPVLFGAMLAGLVYGALYHYALPTPDNVASVSPQGWGLVFIATTGILAALELVAVSVSAIPLMRSRANPSPR